jgi:hypothetical protein
LSREDKKLYDEYIKMFGKGTNTWSDGSPRNPMPQIHGQYEEDAREYEEDARQAETRRINRDTDRDIERSTDVGFAQGGPVNKYQAGGIMQGLGAVSPSPRPVQAQPQQNPIVMGAVAAIMGNHPEPQRAIQDFVQVYGQQAFAALRQQVIAQASTDQRGGAGVASLIRGEGDGLTDDVPANIEGQEPVALSDGEVVVPADVVSGLGNGSSEAGAREIEKMNQGVRQARTGTENQPGAIDAETVLPRLG